MTPRLAITTGATLMFLAVAAGAFGAHALKTVITPDMLAIWQTAVTYHAWHALALVAVGLYLERRPPGRASGFIPVLFALGVLLFSGSLYALALTGVGALGVITPIGGFAWLTGWLLWAWAAWHSPP